MEQKFDATPKAELRLRGRTVTRSDVANDWGLQLRWVVKRDGKVIATPPARADHSYEHPDATPGRYEIAVACQNPLNKTRGACTFWGHPNEYPTYKMPLEAGVRYTFHCYEEGADLTYNITESKLRP